MKALNNKSAERFKKLIANLEENDSVKIANSKSFMALSIDFLGNVSTAAGPGKQFAFAHYYELNGDLIPDPDMEFLYIPEKNWIFPMAYQDTYGYQRSIWWEEGKLVKNERILNDLVSFAQIWLKNICEQQKIAV